MRLGATTTVKYEFFEDGPNRGQVRLERYIDAFGQPKPFLTGAFATRAEYDPQGLLVRAVFLGWNGEPMRNAAGIAEVRVIYDSSGDSSDRPLEISHYDERGQLIQTKNSVAGRTLTYDARCNVVEEEYFDENGHATRSNDGFAKITKTRNYSH